MRLMLPKIENGGKMSKCFDQLANGLFKRMSGLILMKIQKIAHLIFQSSLIKMRLAVID